MSVVGAIVRRVELQLAAFRKEQLAQATTIQQQAQQIHGLLQVQAQQPPSPVANLLWNGEIGHSTNSWNDTAYTVDDKSKEAAWWFSHNAPAAAKTFNSTNVSTGAETVTIANHGFTTGISVDLLAELGGTLPAPLTVTPTVYYLIVVDANTVKFAASVADAFTGTAIDLTTTGTAAKTYTIQPLLDSTDARTSATSQTLKNTSHSTYNAHYSRWDSVNGQARLTGLMTIDQILPANIVDATTPLARVSFIAARRNRYIEIPDACLMAAGIWDNTSEQRKFLTGDVGLTASLVGATGATERRYKVLLTSDRGYSLLSAEVTIANTPAVLSAAAYVTISWKQQAGQLEAAIYEYLPGSATYHLVNNVSSGTSYIHEGSYLADATGYPTPTGTARTATYFTTTGGMSELAIDGVSAMWDTVNFPIGVPSNYNKGNTTNREWLRIWMTVAANLFVEGCSTDGSTTLTAPAAVFEAEYDAFFDAGTLVAQVYDQNDVLLATTTIASRTDDTHVVLGAAIATGTNRKLRIVAGGFHGILLDKIHMGFQQNTSYAPNALDTRILQPVAAPSSSGQGGGGTGGGGGGINCIAEGMPVKLHSGEWRTVDSLKEGSLWAAAALHPNLLCKLNPGIELVRLVRTANGVEIECTDTEHFIVNRTTWHGVPLYRLRVGDQVITEIDDRLEDSTIAFISPYIGKKLVYTPTLSENHLFIAGRLSLSLWQRFKNWCARRRQRCGGIVLHNRKRDPGELEP